MSVEIFGYDVIIIIIINFIALRQAIPCNVYVVDVNFIHRKAVGKLWSI